jgi:DNA-binding CsgD family transcriptional regulator
MNSKPTTTKTCTDLPSNNEFAALTVEHLAQGIAVLDQDSTVLFANAAARTATSRAGWKIKNDRLLCRLATERQTWNDALLRTCHTGHHALVELHAKGAEASVFVSLAPLPIAGLPLALATFEGEHLCGPLELQLFASRHGLTLAENHVLQRLCSGQRPAQIAQEHGVSLTTVLTQIAAIRVKTQRDSVLALLHKLSRLPHSARSRVAALGAVPVVVAEPLV